ncbi:MAG: GDP-mannose 4,6-dehydratase [Acidobacteriia bacterium]|nr:GDP-mannose 4,6-dehydratase [Terriglobia bacterium]
MKSLANEYKGRTALITGADGFIGSHLTETLVEYGADVRVFVRATSSHELRNINHLRDRIRIYRGNLVDKHSVDLAVRDLKDGRDTIIFHLAAQAHVGESWERPYDTVYSNVLGTLNLLQSIVDNDVPIFKLDTAGTSEEYGNVNEAVKSQHDFHENGSVILHERSPLNPKSIYATSKVASDFLTMNYYDAYRLPGVTTRMFNNYGPRQNPRYVTGTIISQALLRDVIELGYVKARRDFCYVDDGVQGHLSVALYGRPGEVYTYGQGENISIEDWYRLIFRIGVQEGYWKEKPLHIVEQRFRPGTSDVEELLVGYQKLHQVSGWKPQVSWEEGIRRTIRWYSENVGEWIGRVDWVQPLAMKEQ